MSDSSRASRGPFRWAGAEPRGRCECAPLFSGRRCERAPHGDAGALLAGVAWRMPPGQPLVLHRGAPRHSSEGGADEPRETAFLIPRLRAVLPAAPDGDAFAGARAPGARARCAAWGSAAAAEAPAALVEAQALDLVVRVAGAGPDALAADAVAVGPAWVDALLRGGGGVSAGGGRPGAGALCLEPSSSDEYLLFLYLNYTDPLPPHPLPTPYQYEPLPPHYNT